MKKDTISQLAEFHYVSESAITRLKRNGIDVHDHIAVEQAIMRQHRRPPAWINGNPNRDGIPFPRHCGHIERDYRICFCDLSENPENECISCRADWDYGCKYFWRKREAEKSSSV